MITSVHFIKLLLYLDVLLRASNKTNKIQNLYCSLCVLHSLSMNIDTQSAKLLFYRQGCERTCSFNYLIPRNYIKLTSLKLSETRKTNRQTNNTALTQEEISYI